MKHPARKKLINALHLIEHSLDERARVDDIAKHIGWSRWQLQRQFTQHLDKNVAEYARALTLSLGAEELISSSFRIVDIANNHGFDIEANFTRAFKQHFGLTPKQYRQAHTLQNIVKPTEHLEFISKACDDSREFVDVSIHTRPETVLYGVQTEIDGLLAGEADIQTQVPQCWERLKAILYQSKDIALENISPSVIGVWDIKYAYLHKGNAKYWACIHPKKDQMISQLQRIVIPEQAYVFIKLKCNIKHLVKAVEWLVHIWLPHSAYSHITAYDLEFYKPNQKDLTKAVDITYAIPVSLKNAPK